MFSRSSRNSTIRPVELGRRLLREMDDQRSVDVKGRRIVPNMFTFHLSPRDHAGFADIEDALIHELGEAAREYARDEGYHFVGPVGVEIVVDNALKPGRFGVASVLREGAPEPVSVAAGDAGAGEADAGFAIVEEPRVSPPAAAPFKTAGAGVRTSTSSGHPSAGPNASLRATPLPTMIGSGHGSRAMWMTCAGSFRGTPIGSWRGW